MKKISVLLAMALVVGVALLRADEVSLDTNALATLAVQDHGRKKPFTTFAHEMLLTLSGKPTLPVADGKKLQAEEVILDLWFKPQGWDNKPVIMLNFLELKKKLGLPEDQKLFTYNELIGKQALLDLIDEAQKLRQAGQEDKVTALQKEAEHLGERLKLFQDLVSGDKETVVPNAQSIDARWNFAMSVQGGQARTFGVLSDGSNDAGARKAGEVLTAWYQAYNAGDIAKFNGLTPQVVESFRVLAPQFYPPASSLQFEHNYMTLEPFLWAWIIYLIALIVLLLTGLWGKSIGYKLT